jgi:putative aminopeptidase FrvX
MELVKKLCNAYGPAGREDRVRDIIKKEIKNHCQHIEIDRLGNLIARVSPESRKNASDRIMLCAHMDEIGLIVTHIDERGFCRFTSVGGIFPQRILYERVIFENDVIGIIGVETKPDTPKPPRMDNMFIDIGVHSKEEALEKVQIGDIASFYQETQIIHNRLIGKALDDRLGCYCLIQVMKSIKKPSGDLYFVFTVQEEVGCRGAKTGAFSIGPKYALAVDLTITGDTPGCPKMEIALGKGVAVKIKDHAFIAHPKIKDTLIDYAKAAKVPFQLEILEGGTTDASVIQLVKEGVQSGVVSIPGRYVHSINEMCDLADVEGAIKVLTRVCEKGIRT